MTRKAGRSKTGEEVPERQSESSDEPAREASEQPDRPGKARKRKPRSSPSRKVAAKPAAKAKPGGKPAEAKKGEPEKGRVALPAFGFAEDLLEKPAAAEPGEDDAAAPVDPADPRRIFAFADGLEKNAVGAEPAAAPVRLETWVAFSLAGEVFALPVAPVREVVRVTSITRVPHAPSPIRGVTNMRGRVIPVIDLRLRIELPEAELGRASRVIVVSSRGRLLGLLVDAVHQVIHIDPAGSQPPPDDVMTAQSDYISAVYHLDDQLILLLDLDRCLIVQEAVFPKASRGAPANGKASGDAAASA